MPDRLRKRPRDPNRLAKLIVDIATGQGRATPQTAIIRADPAVIRGMSVYFGKP